MLKEMVVVGNQYLRFVAENPGKAGIIASAKDFFGLVLTHTCEPILDNLPNHDSWTGNQTQETEF